MSTTPVQTNTTSSTTVTTEPATTPTLAPPSDAATIIERMNNGLSGINSYRVNRLLDITSGIITENQTEKTRVQVWCVETLDLSGNKMQMKNTFNYGSGTVLQENAIYISGDWIYILGYFPEEPDQWAKSPASAEYWSLQNQAQRIYSLSPVSSATVLASEIVPSGNSNIACDVLLINPDLEKFWEFIRQQPGIHLSAGAPAGATFSQILKIAEFKLWVSQTTGRLVQADISLRAEIGPDLMPTLTDNTYYEVSLMMSFLDYNQPVTITLPAETDSAVDISVEPEKLQE
jgi:hypothetical protein